MAATMKDIARLTGLSLATISKHLNGGKVLEENRIKIDNAIKELDFHVNEFARSLKTNKSNTIGILLADYQTFFCTSIVHAAEEYLIDKGYTVLVSDSQLNPQIEQNAFMKLVGRRVDGIVALPVNNATSEMVNAHRLDTPVVFIDQENSKYKNDVAYLDVYDSIYNATSYLIDNGHTKIGIITSVGENRTMAKRINGYKDALAEHEIDFREEYQYNDHNMIMLTGYNGIKSLLSLPDPPTAIISLCSELTLGAYIALTELHVKMPDDLSFIGVDLLELNLISSIELTRIVLPVHDIANSALDILLHNIENKSNSSLRHRVEIGCDFKIGKSSGPVPQNPKRYLPSRF